MSDSLLINEKATKGPKAFGKPAPRVEHSEETRLTEASILLVEDKPLNRVLFEDMFAFDEIPARLVAVESGEEAIRVAPSQKPLLILMDIRLPGIDGLKTARVLKQDPATKHIPIWAITAFAMPEDKVKARAAGCSAYITKPINTKAFADQLRNFLAKASPTPPE